MRSALKFFYFPLVNYLVNMEFRSTIRINVCLDVIISRRFKLSSLYQNKARLSVLILGGRLIAVLRKMKPSSAPLKGGRDGLTKVASCKRFFFI